MKVKKKTPKEEKQIYIKNNQENCHMQPPEITDILTTSADPQRIY